MRTSGPCWSRYAPSRRKPRRLPRVQEGQGQSESPHAQHRKRAIAIGEKFGLYKDWPVSKGYTPPYVPVWVEAVVKQKG
jgi:hypothetical protein